MVKIATPISHLFENEDYSRKIMSCSDCLEFRKHRIGTIAGNQEIFHSDLQPIHELTKADFDYLSYIKNSKHDLKLVTFHIASSCDKPYLVNRMYEPGGKQYSETEMLKNAQKNILLIKGIMGKDVKLAVENNNYFPTDAYRYVTEPEFISHLVRENDIYFLLDIAHARITSHNKKLDYGKYKNRLPLDRTIQIHICSCEFGANHLAYDTHNYPTEQEYTEVKRLLDKFDIQYLTIEYYANLEYLLQSLRRLREIA